MAGHRGNKPTGKKVVKKVRHAALARAKARTKHKHR